MPCMCVITFNENPSGVYYSGQILSGKVNLTIDKIKAVKGIYITIGGQSHVCWLESSGFLRQRSMNLFFAHEEYLKVRMELAGNSNEKLFDLAPGNYEYYFQIALPHELPSSFNSRCGKIAYEAICTIERSKKSDIEFKHPFTVISPLDLNLHQSYMHSVNRESIQTFNKFLCCGNDGVIAIKASTPVGGYVPGQLVSVSFHINNKTSIGVYDTKASLRQIIEYRSYTPRKQSKYQPRIIDSNSFGKLDEGQEKTFYCTFYIPAVPPSSLCSSKIIEISYDIEIYLKTYEFHKDVTVRLPITIGTFPHRNTSPERFEEQSPSILQNQMSDVALPTYEEAVRLGSNFVDSRNENSNSVNDYVPRYPVYNNNNTNQSMASPNDIPAVIITQPMA